MKQYDVVVVGGGPAGITSAIYCKRANLNVVVLDSYVIGGNPNNYLEIENYPGMGKITTEGLVNNFISHLEQLEIPFEEFVKIEKIDLATKTVVTSKEEYSFKHLIVATGSKPRMLGVEGEAEHVGRGVHYCAICDGPLYKDKIVAVIGGGNSACEEALGLAKICKQVYILEFTDKLNADQTTVDKIYNTENIEVHTSYAVDKIVEAPVGLIVMPTADDKLGFSVDGIFPYIGMVPNVPTLMSGEYDVVLPVDNAGFLKVDEDMHLVDDVYAVGDVTSKKYRQVVTAVADGAIAAISISKKS